VIRHSSNPKKWLVPAIKLVIVVLVVCGIGWEIAKARGTFQQKGFALAELDFRWLLAAGALYLLGMLPMGVFWYTVMRALGQVPRLGETLRAFYIGNLGKYVPGKAMVVILRTGLIRSGRVDTTVAAVSVFTETLTMMAVGAFLAAVILAVRFTDQWLLLALAVGLMLCAGLPTVPPIFRHLVYVLRVRKANPEIGEWLKGLTLKVMSGGWIGNLVGWTCIGLSLWATLRAMPGTEGKLADPATSIPLVTATVCLAMVAGFLSLLPGGVGVREYVLMRLMVEQFDPVTAIVSAVLLRVVWLVSESALAAVLYASIRSPGAQTSPVAGGGVGGGRTESMAGDQTEDTRSLKTGFPQEKPL